LGLFLNDIFYINDLETDVFGKKLCLQPFSGAWNACIFVSTMRRGL
jgi:hypothetical protein